MGSYPNREVKFRKIPSLDFLYEVSEDGRIVRNVKSKHQLYMDKDWGGYYRVSPVYKGKQIHRFVHVLVAECWLGKKPEGYECDHIDNDRHNNHYTNLRYVTKAENLKKRVFTEEGKRRNGEITRARYMNATDDEKRKMLQPLLDARKKPEFEEARIKAVVTALGHPMTIEKDGIKIHFASKAKCCKYIARKDGCSEGAIRYYINQKRKYVHGYHVSYEK